MKKSSYRKSFIILVNFLLFLLFSLGFLNFFYSLKTENFISFPYAFTDNSFSLIVEPEDGVEPIINSIKNAKEYIFVEVYMFTHKEMLQSLYDAKTKGVQVKVILEEAPFGGFSQNKDTKDWLSRSKIETKWGNKIYNYTHSKFIIIDGKEAFISTANFSKAAFEKNREYILKTTNQEVVKELAKIFDSDWKRYAYKSDSLILSPINSREKITNLIKLAKKEILIEMQVIEDDEIITLILKKQKEGVNIKIIIPPLEKVDTNKKAFDIFNDYKVNIKILSYPYLHAKMMIIDSELAYIGSVNFSSNSLDNNREVGIILKNKEIIQKLKEIFKTDL